MYGLGDRAIAADAALATLLDHDLFGAAVRKALAHGASFDARLERQGGLARYAEFLFTGVSRIGHSTVLSLVVRGAHR
jgi:hypothetical protein